MHIISPWRILHLLQSQQNNAFTSSSVISATLTQHFFPPPFYLVPGFIQHSFRVLMECCMESMPASHTIKQRYPRKSRHSWLPSLSMWQHLAILVLVWKESKVRSCKYGSQWKAWKILSRLASSLPFQGESAHLQLLFCPDCWKNVSLSPSLSEQKLWTTSRLVQVTHINIENVKKPQLCHTVIKFY